MSLFIENKAIYAKETKGREDDAMVADDLFMDGERLQFAEATLDRAEVIDLIIHLQRWLETGSLAPQAEAKEQT